MNIDPGKELLQRYGIANANVELLADTDSEIYRVNCTQNGEPKAYAFKIYRPDVERVDIKAEMYWLSSLSANTTLLVPTPIKALDYSLLQCISDGNSSRTAVMLSWLDGEHPAANIDCSVLRSAGTLLGRLHLHSSQFMKASDVPSQRPAFVSYLENWEAANEIAEDGADVLLRCLPIIQSIFSPRTVDSACYGYLHGDFHPWNLIIGKGGLGAIDFSDCGWGPYAYDIASNLIYFKYPLVWDFDYSSSYADFEAAFLSGYKSVNPLPPDFTEILPVCFAVRMFVVAQFVTDDFDSIDETDWGRRSLTLAVNYLRKFTATVDA